MIVHIVQATVHCHPPSAAPATRRHAGRLRHAQVSEWQRKDGVLEFEEIEKDAKTIQLFLYEGPVQCSFVDESGNPYSSQRWSTSALISADILISSGQPRG